MPVAFVFDQAKSASNKLKHGIDFIDAQAIWRDDKHVVIAARIGAEERFIVIGRIADKHWSAVVTYRGEECGSSRFEGPGTRRFERMDAAEFDKKFDEGLEDIMGDLDMSTATRPRLKPRRVNVDLPVWMVEALDDEAMRLGVPRQSIIKVWIAERLEKTR